MSWQETFVEWADWASDQFAQMGFDALIEESKTPHSNCNSMFGDDIPTTSIGSRPSLFEPGDDDFPDIELRPGDDVNPDSPCFIESWNEKPGSRKLTDRELATITRPCTFYKSMFDEREVIKDEGVSYDDIMKMRDHSNSTVDDVTTEDVDSADLLFDGNENSTATTEEIFLRVTPTRPQSVTPEKVDAISSGTNQPSPSPPFRCSGNTSGRRDDVMLGMMVLVIIGLWFFRKCYLCWRTHTRSQESLCDKLGQCLFFFICVALWDTYGPVWLVGMAVIGLLFLVLCCHCCHRMGQSRRRANAAYGKVKTNENNDEHGNDEESNCSVHGNNDNSDLTLEELLLL